MKRICIAAPAKINLTLDVLGQRPDRYHEIQSIMQTIDLADRLTITPTPNQPGVELEVVGDQAAGVPTDSTNIVVKAALRLQEIAEAELGISRDRLGVHVLLEKNIPSQAGLGGGSSDSAATLRAVNELFDLNLPETRLSIIAASLGADVPFFLTGGTAHVTGIGDRVIPLAPLEPNWVLILVKPEASVSTADAYAKLDSLPNRVSGAATAHWVADGAGYGPLGNDFEQVVLGMYPAIANVFEFFRNTVNLTRGTPLLCGSGSAVFCQAMDQESANAAAARAESENIGKAWVVRTTDGRLQV